MWLVSRLGIEHVLGLVKLLLLEGRILLFSHAAPKASAAVLALLTLVPGLYNQVGGRQAACTQAQLRRTMRPPRPPCFHPCVEAD
jgi:hypothetical protein